MKLRRAASLVFLGLRKHSRNAGQLLINPFLIRAFNFTDHREVIRFCFYQKVTRSIVTSWGFVVQDMLIVTGSMPATEKGFDVRIDRDGKEQALLKESKYGTGRESIEKVLERYL